MAMVRREGFTLIEVMVALGIVILITSAGLANFRGNSSNTTTALNTDRLVSDLRLVAFKALNQERFQTATPGGWGINFSEERPNEYTIFADLDGDRAYDNREKYQTVTFNDQVHMTWQGYPIGALVFNVGDATPYASDTRINTVDGDLAVKVTDTERGTERMIYVNIAGAVNPE